MKTLLVVEVSPRLEFSVSRNLTARFVEQWKSGNPHGVVGDIGGKQMETNSEGATGAQDLAALVGRVMMSALFLWGGFANLTAAAQMDAYFSSLGLPFPDLVRLFAVAVELSGGLAVMFGFQARLAAAGLAVWCIVTALVGHTNFADADAQIQFMKNVAMSGGFIFIAAFGPGAYALARGWRRTPAIS
jgi:putative oxidoreductase